MSQSHKPPAYQWYPRDFISDPDVVVLSMVAEGCFRRLLDFAWMQDGLPDDPETLKRLCKSPRRWDRIWTELGRLWRTCSDGKLRNDRQEEIRANLQKHSREQAEYGRQGAEKRWGAHREPTSTPMGSDSSSSSSAKKGNKTTPKKESAKTPSEWQGRVQAVMDALGKPIAAPRAAKILKAWDELGDSKLLAAIATVRDRYPDHPPNYLLQVVETARKNGGAVATPKPTIAPRPGSSPESMAALRRLDDA